MKLTFDELRVPLTLHPRGTVRVGKTKVALESIIVSYRGGYTPQDIKRQYPDLNMGDIYLVIGYYLQCKEEVDQYMKEWEEDWDQFEEEMLAQPGAREFYEQLWERVRQKELAEQEELAKRGEDQK